jgi:hypothetical protein
MKTNHSRALGLLTVVVVSGCAVAPTVEISKISQPSDLRGDEIDTYFLQRSLLLIDKSGTTKTAEGKEVDALSISSVPDEYVAFKLGLRRADSFGVKTNLNLTKVPNTDLLKEVGAEVVDSRVELIGKIGAIVTKVVAAAFDANKGLEPGALPKKINVSVLMDSAKVQRDGAEGVDASGGVTIDFGAIPPDADSFENLKLPVVSKGLIYSACRQATVRFKYAGNNYAKTLKVSDPHFYQRVSFPIKGKVSFHSECGVSVTSDKDTGVSSTTDIVEAVGKAISDGIDASKKK